MTDTNIITFGCRLNHYESEVIRETCDPERDVVIVNSCAVTQEAVRQARQTIRRLRRDHPEKRLIVTGCAAQCDPEQFAAMPEVDLVLGNREKFDPAHYRGDGLGTTDSKIRVNDIMMVRETAGHMLTGFSDRVRAFVEIQNGCDHRCTFCIIPYGRGNSRSVPMGAVVEQIKRLTDNAVQEVVLTGVDITSYGADLPGKPALGRLVAAILQHVPALPRLRLSSLDSIEVDPLLQQLLVHEDRLMPHLHLSLQAGDNLILKRMKRRHDRDHAIAFCQGLRSRRPDMVFGADLIAGFPTEDEDMFARTVDLITACGLTYVHVFPFSPRIGTPAARMPQLSKQTIRARAAKLRAVGDQVRDEFFQRLIGSRQHILMETETTGHSQQFAPIRTLEPTVPGTFIDIEVMGVRAGQLIGKIVA